jgi:cytochrome c553
VFRLADASAPHCKSRILSKLYSSGTVAAGLGSENVRAPIELFALTALLTAACSDVTTRTDARLSRTGELVALSGGDGGAANACFSCHGLDGLGDADATPRLAGLDAGYLHKQLEDYVNGQRPDPVMTAIAKRLTPHARQAVASHYALMPAPEGSVSAAPPPAAYASCVVCHGEAGQGAGAGNPAIAGQPAAYVADQLHRWRKAERRNDPRGVMRVAAQALDEAEIAAIAAWLEFRSASRPPDSAAASVTASVPAWEAPAASRAGHRPGR